MCVRTRLGEFEAKDQISAAKYWSTLPYVDKNRMAIWGWSFGGFVTSKVIEADSGAFQIGIAVAPVIDWRFYDSVYTERYMKTPELNPNGYELSAVTNMTGFDNAKFLLIHGTGDDNVHFQNSLSLIDRFTLASVHNYRVQIYTDSDHSIQKHNANREEKCIFVDKNIEEIVAIANIDDRWVDWRLQLCCAYISRIDYQQTLEKLTEYKCLSIEDCSVLIKYLFL
ncbi:21971_t:CDS:2 [Entrophospora sp. SA101]|nr:21971_t:CDS:2 [Entrophospora sp. SA101]